MMTKKKIAVVTGGAGFIGSHTVDLLLSRGMTVRVIDDLSGGFARNVSQHQNNPSFALEEKNILDITSDSSIFSDANYVFHFAGKGDIVPSIDNPELYMNTNVLGTVKMLECARQSRNLEKFVYAASSSCYGLADVPTTEAHPISPQYPYALSKYQGEQAVFHWHQVYQLPVNSIRIFNAYGTRVRTTGVYGAVFGVFFKQKLAGKPFTVVGDGQQRRDFIYVTDVASAFLAAAQTNITGERWNIGSDNPQTINHLVELIGGDMTYIPKRPGEPDCTWADTSKIKRDLHWQAEVSFAEGVSRMMDNINYWKDAPLWDEESIAKATKTWFECLSD